VPRHSISALQSLHFVTHLSCQRAPVFSANTSSVWFLLNIANMRYLQDAQPIKCLLEQTRNRHTATTVWFSNCNFVLENANDQAKGHNMWHTLVPARPEAMCFATLADICAITAFQHFRFTFQQASLSTVAAEDGHLLCKALLRRQCLSQSINKYQSTYI